MFISENVTRACNDDGTWFVHPDTNKTWSDYLACSNVSQPGPTPPHGAGVPPVIQVYLKQNYIYIFFS